MINERQIDLLVERLIRRVEEANTYFLKKMGASISKIRELTPTQAQQLVQILKYGGSYEQIIEEISKYTNLNVADIENIFNSYAKKDQLFYEKFYKYRDIPFTPFEENMALKTQTMALTSMAKNEMYNFTRTNVLGYTVTDLQGNDQFLGLRDTYNELLNRALLNVGQGKETFDSAMTGIMKEIGVSGLKTIEFENGRSIRLDSAIRMHLKGRLMELHNENQEIIGEEIEADGVEISVHANPADDHADAQGRQFTNEQFTLLQTTGTAEDINGKVVDMHRITKKGVSLTHRPISEMNCYHYVFSVVLGVNKPEYTEEQLEEIKQSNSEGFDYEGNHYTNYEGTQLQRAIERAIREQKDTQILAKTSGNTELVGETQQKITQLTRKYKELSNISRLPTKMERMKVSGYRRTKVNQPKINNYKEIEYARKNNTIWHSTENLEEIINSDKILEPSMSVGKEMSKKVKYGTQFIEFKPELLENVNKSTLLYKGDGGNQFSKEGGKFNNLMQMLKDKPEIYNELKFNEDLDALKYIKKVHIRQDEPKQVIDLLKSNNIDYEFYIDKRIRGFKKKKV